MFIVAFWAKEVCLKEPFSHRGKMAARGRPTLEVSLLFVGRAVPDKAGRPTDASFMIRCAGISDLKVGIAGPGTLMHCLIGLMVASVRTAPLPLHSEQRERLPIAAVMSGKLLPASFQGGALLASSLAETAIR